MGPNAPATKRGRSEVAAVSAASRAIRALARLRGAHLAGEAVVLLGHAVRVEGVGGDDVGARFEEARVDVADDLRPGDGEEVVVAGELAVVIGKESAAKVGLAQRVALDHRAHRPVQHQHAPGRGRVERGVPYGAPVFRRPRGSRLSVVPSCYRHALPRWPAAQKKPAAAEAGRVPTL